MWIWVLEEKQLAELHGHHSSEAPISKVERQISDSFWATFFAEWTGYNPRHIRWDSWDVFCPPNVGFCELALQKPEREIQQWKVKIHNFLLEYRLFEAGRLLNFHHFHVYFATKQ